MSEEELFLPVIMTHCTHEERQAAIKASKKFVENGVWIGGKGGRVSGKGARPCFKFPTAAAKRKNVGRGRLSLSVSHLVLIEEGKYPQEDEQASHLCHDPSCIDPNHLVWERGDFNLRRKRCFARKKCICRQPKKCIFDAHLP